jgi:hypothetical protein
MKAWHKMPYAQLLPQATGRYRVSDHPTVAADPRV